MSKKGYTQSKIVPGLCKHATRPIQLTLIKDNFGVKFVGKENAKHLLESLQEFYKVSMDSNWEKFIGPTLDWDYDRHEVHLSNLGYVQNVLHHFQHPTPTTVQDSPYLYMAPKHGATMQYAEIDDDSPLDKNGKKVCSGRDGNHSLSWEGNGQHNTHHIEGNCGGQVNPMKQWCPRSSNCSTIVPHMKMLC